MCWGLRLVWRIDVQFLLLYNVLYWLYITSHRRCYVAFRIFIENLWKNLTLWECRKRERLTDWRTAQWPTHEPLYLSVWILKSLFSCRCWKYFPKYQKVWLLYSGRFRFETTITDVYRQWMDVIHYNLDDLMASTAHIPVYPKIGNWFYSFEEFLRSWSGGSHFMHRKRGI